ncbi:MAG: ABC transporter permease [Actinomycetota bacterium]|nr:ABC transporter permease [Actinomycetota bacterium]MDH5277686.1 ABC transporter permease [Actinomycetota bacterium]
MGGYIARRLLAMVGMLFGLSIITFLLFSALPADPARLTCGKSCTPEIVEANRVRLGLDQPLAVQYGRFMVAIPCGRIYPTTGPILQCPALSGETATEAGTFMCDPICLGYSFRQGETVTNLIVEALPVTLSVALGAFVLWLVVGILSGVYAALRRGRWQDRTTMGIALIGYSFPSFFIGLVLLYFVAFQIPEWTGLTYPYPKFTPFSESPGLWFWGLLLPWITLAMLYAAFYTRLTRNQMLETLGEDYIRTARSKGLSERTVIYKHGLRAGLTPIVTAAGLDLAGLLGGAIIAEQVFNLQGLGRLAIQSVSDADLPVLTGIVLITSFFVILGNLVVDVLYAAIDPRVRLA